MTELGRYDSELQMFLEEAGPIDLNMLDFWRWLVQTGRLIGDTAPEDN